MRPALLAAALALAAPALAADDGATPVEVEVGKTLNLCRAGLLNCPASTFMCDDPKVARIENGTDGAELKAVSPGTTICSGMGFERAFRRVMRVTVKPPKPPAPQGS